MRHRSILNPDLTEHIILDVAHYLDQYISNFSNVNYCYKNFIFLQKLNTFQNNQDKHLIWHTGYTILY